MYALMVIFSSLISTVARQGEVVEIRSPTLNENHTNSQDPRAWLGVYPWKG